MYKDKVCELCGRTFTPKGGVAKYCKLPVEKICIVCGKPFTTICHPKSNDVCDNAECKKKAGFVASVKAVNRICRVCGKPFAANSSRQLDCGKEIIKKCEICGKFLIWDPKVVQICLKTILRGQQGIHKETFFPIPFMQPSVVKQLQIILDD